MKFLSYIVLFVLHAVVWVSLFLLIVYTLAYLSFIFLPSFSNDEFGPNLFLGLAVWSSLFAFWLSFKSTAYSAGEGEGFLTAMKLAWFEVKNFLIGLLPWKN